LRQSSKGDKFSANFNH